MLQYLDLQVVSCELERVLKREGKAIFVEPFSNSHVMQFVLEKLKWVWGCPFHGKPLTIAGLGVLGKPFSQISCKEFGFLSRMERIIYNRKIIRYVRMTDGLLLEWMPCFRKYARSVVIELVK